MYTRAPELTMASAEQRLLGPSLLDAIGFDQQTDPRRARAYDRLEHGSRIDPSGQWRPPALRWPASPARNRAGNGIGPVGCAGGFFRDTAELRRRCAAAD